MKKHILKSLVLLASVSLAACNIPGGKTSNTSNSTSEQESVVPSTTSGTTSADSTSSNSSSSAVSSSSSAYNTSSSSSTTSSNPISSSSSSSSSSSVIPDDTSLDGVIAKFTDGLTFKVPSLNKYNLDYFVYYYYAYQEYRVAASALTGGDAIVNELVTLCNNESTLVSMNDEYFYTVEEVGYMYGNDEFGSDVSITFYSENDQFYFEIARSEGAGKLDVSSIDTNWYVDYINFEGYTVVEAFPSDLINGFFETNVTIPSMGEGNYPALIIPYAEEEDGSITPDTFRFIMEGDKINAFATALEGAGFGVNVQEEIGLDESWEEYTYYLGSAYDQAHSLYFSFMLDNSSNTLVAVNKFHDVMVDELTENTDWTDDEKALMESTLYECLPFMKFGSDYTIEDASDEDYTYLFLGDYYYQDLSSAYAEVLKANGFKEDLETYYTPCYTLDNGCVYIEVMPYYNYGNCLEIYFEDTHLPILCDFALNISELDIVKGVGYQLQPVFDPVDAYNKIIWTSDNEDVATVNDNGFVSIKNTAEIDAKATITATCLNGMSATCTFTVRENVVTGIMFEQDTYMIAPGESTQTQYALLPYGATSSSYEVEYSVNPADAGISVGQYSGEITASNDAIAGTEITLTIAYNGVYTGTAKVIVKAAAITHTLNQAFFGLENGKTVYDTHTVTTDDGTYYEAQCASQHGIQIRSKNNNSGIIARNDDMKCKSITITFDSNTDSSRVVEIYASVTAFDITDMYGSSVTKVGTISASGNSFTYEFTDNYSYIGLRSSSGAIYITSIDIIWG